MNKIKLFFIFLTTILVITSCATPYKRASNPENFGYYDNVLQQDIYEITFNGNENTSLIKAQDYTLLRASEICIENGYQTFDIVNLKDNSKTEIGSLPVYGYYNSTTLVFSATVPKITLIIKCSKEDNFTFIAEQIKENLRKKYNMK